ncbi:TonB family protein [Draconibacterium orientale]|uniref:TonB family protein n=1 Tax=Draconibacterium orientale TaxID=1168034 RepID=UPI002A0A0F02|nr:TonB family protein [Draconibacterium orientale]
MNKYLLLLFVLLMYSTGLKSQETIKLFYTSDWKVTKEDEAIYYRESEYDLNNFELDGSVFDYALSGKLIMEGNYLNGKKNGNFIFYYDNGEIKNKGQYENNRRIGRWEYFYNNGKLKQVVLFKSRNEHDFSVLEYYNRDGKQLLENGTGKWKNDSIQTGMFDTESLKTVTGQFNDSLKHGVWKLIRISDNKLMHSERFQKGKLVEATIYNAQFDYYGTISSEIVNKIPDENSTKFINTEKFDLDTTVYPVALLFSDVETIFETITGKKYEVQNRDAGYIYGDYSLLEFLEKNIRYPRSAVDERITGKVYVGVVIDSLGNTRKVQLVKGIHEDLDKEAQRVVRLVDKWMPAIRDGKVVKSTITIPVNFQIKE